MIHLLFGEMGVGKNHVGEMLAAHLGCLFYDGDDALTPEMADRASRFRPISAEMVDRFVKDSLIPEIAKRAMMGNLVVAQALYRRKHRLLIQEQFGARLIHVTAPSLAAHVKRLASRSNGWKWAAYGLLSKPFFESPRPGEAFTLVSGQLAILTKDIADLYPR